MAIAPLFLADMDTVKEKLRLSGIKSAADHLVDEAVQKVRTGFYRRLGAAKINTLLAVGFTENATTDAAMLRTVANTTEVDWVRLHLLETLPVVHMDGGSQTQSIWNDEAAFRRTADMERADMMKRLRADIEESLDMLDGTEEMGDERDIRCDTLYPTSTTPSDDDDYVNPYPGGYLL